MRSPMWRRGLLASIAIALTSALLVTVSSSAGAARPILHATLVDVSGTTVGEVVFKGRANQVTFVELRR